MMKLFRRLLFAFLGLALPLSISSVSHASPVDASDEAKTAGETRIENSNPSMPVDPALNLLDKLVKPSDSAAETATNAEKGDSKPTSKEETNNSSVLPYGLEAVSEERGVHDKTGIKKLSVKFRTPERIYNLALYDEFIDEAAAWNLVLRDYQPELKWLQKDAKLSTLSKSTVSEWVDASNASLESANSNLRMGDLNWYLFGFEAREWNQNIVNNLRQATKSLNQGIPREKNSALDEVNNLLNMEGDNNHFDAAYGMHAPELETRAAFNVKAANSYAWKWRNSPNPTYVYFSGNDCANFASQIKRAGGATMTGRWFYHSRKNYRKNISESWRIANSFAKYWGLTNRTTNLATFASRLHPGSFIGFSNERGHVSHIGYVHVVSSQKAKYKNTWYRVFGVTQHTKNYAGWARVGYKAAGWLSQKGWVTK